MELIRERLQQAKITQDQARVLLSVSQPAVSMYLSGEMTSKHLEDGFIALLSCIERLNKIKPRRSRRVQI